MQRSKVVFLIIAAIFLVVVLLIILDFSRRTSFPGHHADRQTKPLVVE
jgi:hypothetical protein